MCQDYEWDQCDPDPMRNSMTKAHPVPTNEMDKGENKWEIKKSMNVEFASNMVMVS